MKVPGNTTLRARGWVFTINNYTQQTVDHLQYLIDNKDDAQYVCFGKEVGARGTPHLQGYIQYSNKKTRNQVSKDVGKAYLDIRQGTIPQAIAYCKKDGDFTEFGIRPLSPKEKGCTQKNRWAEITELAHKGLLDQLENKYPREFLLYRPRLLSIYKPDRKPLDGELPHEWWVGPTGAGKSKLLWELYPDHFAKTLNKWWDNYAFQDVVVIEEWSPKNECTASFLKVWADRYAYPCEVKGAMLPMIRPKKIIILSNYTIEQCFHAKEDCDPLLRRFKVITFPDGKLHAQARVNNYVPSIKEEIPVTSEICDAILEEEDTDASPMSDIACADFDWKFDLDSIMASPSTDLWGKPLF